MKGAGGLLSPAGKRRVCTSMKILFVCTGNTCRSPMAEGIFRKMMVERGMEERVLCQSAGLSAVEGAPVSENAVLACREIGVDISDHTARRISGRSFPCGICTSPCPRPTGTSWPRPGCPRRKSTSPSTSPTPMGPPGGLPGLPGQAGPAAGGVLRELRHPAAGVRQHHVPAAALPRGQPAPPLTYGKKRESCQKRGFGASFWARQAETRPALEFCGLAVYNRLVVLLP